MPRTSKETKTVVFNGVVYRKSPSQRYYSRTRVRQKALLLHREVWAHHHGPIPAGYEVHHKDGNTENNDVSNLECLTSSEHAKRHHPGGWRLRPCPVCGALFSREGNREVFCSHVCANRGRKPRQFTCTQCGACFSSNGYGRYGSVVRFCSDACGEAYRYRQRGTPRECAWCGEVFPAKHRVSKFCSSRCAARHRVWHQHRPGL